MKAFEACVIGAGPAGITAALYLSRSGCSVMLVEQMTPGGQVLQTASLENYPGFPKGIKGYELADAMAEHLDGLSIDRVTGEVVAVSGRAGDFAVSLADGASYTARTVLVCSGARHRKLGLPDEERLTGHGVSYCALCDGNFFRGRPVAVVGGGNAALEESLYLANIVSSVHLIHRRSEFRGRQIYQSRLLNSDKVSLHLNSIVSRLHGDSDLDGITIRNVQSGEEETLACDAVFIYVGFEPVTSFLPDTIKVDPQGFIITDTEMASNIPGIFAAGDIRSKNCRQVITAAGDGATAAQAAFVFLGQLNA